jgi:shikimate dehydrogenase
LLLDLLYAAEVTPWVRRARAQGLSAHDGLGLLVHQARRSLALWFGTLPPLGPLARAVGWPR